MKHLIASLFACVLLLAACSSDPKPDRATPFIGDWKTDPADSVVVYFQSFWKIERSGANMVNIVATDSIISKVDDFLPSIAMDIPVYNSKIDESGTLVLNYSRSIPGTIFKYTGSASIVDGKLVANISTVSSADGPLGSKTLIFHR